MWPLWQSIKGIFLKAFLPVACYGCGSSDTPVEGPFCKDCLREINAMGPGSRCTKCGQPTAKTIHGCLGCHDLQFSTDSLLVYADYVSPLKEALHHAKFDGNRKIALWLGKVLTNLTLPEAEALVPVPLSKTRLIQRGFNQSLVFAEVISKKTGIPLRADILVKVKDTPAQSLLSGRARLQNPIGAYRARGWMPSRVILVDDVYTTGATMNECARVLKEAGVSVVHGLVLMKAGL